MIGSPENNGSTDTERPLGDEVECVLVDSGFGYHYHRTRCPRCKIWLDGPSIVEEGNVQKFDSFPTPSHEIVRMAEMWRKRLIEYLEVPLDHVHIHIQIVDLNVHPDWYDNHLRTSIEYYMDGVEVLEPKEIAEGKFNGVIINIHPDDELSWRDFERLLLRELMYVVFPSDEQLNDIPLSTYRKRFPKDQINQTWVLQKVVELIREYGTSASEEYGPWQ